jgi:hypothetical protein
MELNIQNRKTKCIRNNVRNTQKGYIFHEKCPESIKPGHLLFAFEVSKECRVFLEFEDFEKFKEFYIREDKKHYYEVILGSHRFYLDIDAEFDISNGSNTPEIGSDFERKIIQDTVKGIMKVFDDVDIRKDIFIFSSHGEDTKKDKVIIKKSFHIIVHRVINTPELSKNIAHLIKQYSGVSFIDINVYKPKQQLRVLYSTKLGSKRIKIFEGNWIFEGEWICSQVTKDDELKYSLVNLLLDARNESARIFKLLNSTSKNNPRSSTKKILNLNNTSNDPEGESASRMIVKVVEDEIGDSIEGSENLQISEVKKDYNGSYLIILKNKGGYVCPIHKRVHEKENPFIIADTNDIFFCCRRNEAGDKRVYYLRKKGKRVNEVRKIEKEFFYEFFLKNEDGY